MLLSLLGYVVLGLVLAVPLWRLMFWMAARLGLYTPAWHYVKPYLPNGKAAPTQPSAPGPD